jgi:hypothetical protein
MNLIWGRRVFRPSEIEELLSAYLDNYQLVIEREEIFNPPSVYILWTSLRDLAGEIFKEVS